MIEIYVSLSWKGRGLTLIFFTCLCNRSLSLCCEVEAHDISYVESIEVRNIRRCGGSLHV